MNLVAVNDPKSIPSGKLYYYGLFGGAHRNFIPDDATFQQMKSSGSLTYFKPQIAKDVAKYDLLCRSMQSYNESNRNLYIEVRKARAMIFSFRYNEVANDVWQKNRQSPSQAGIDSFIHTNPPLLTYDKTLFNEYVELVRSRFIRFYNLNISDSLLNQAKVVLNELNKEYH